jgi:hypothetical protein
LPTLPYLSEKAQLQPDFFDRLTPLYPFERGIKGYNVLWRTFQKISFAPFQMGSNPLQYI